MLLNDIQVVLLLIIFGGGIYLSYRRGTSDGYDMGYEHACYDVAVGNIKVEIKE